MYQVLYQHDINEKVREWVNNNTTIIDWKKNKNE
jgi:hypothetical protein